MSRGGGKRGRFQSPCATFIRNEKRVSFIKKKEKKIPRSFMKAAQIKCVLGRKKGRKKAEEDVEARRVHG